MVVSKHCHFGTSIICYWSFIDTLFSGLGNCCDLNVLFKSKLCAVFQEVVTDHDCRPSVQITVNKQLLYGLSLLNCLVVCKWFVNALY